ncbi:MAG: hypothetical protein ACJ72X_06355 [Nitrososphaeraceae archaeon]
MIYKLNDFFGGNVTRTKTLTISDMIWYIRLHDKDLKSQNYLLTFTSINLIFILLLPLTSNSLFHKAFAASPAFDQVLITDEKISNQENDWAQTYGNDSTHLRSDYANILACK